MEIVQTGIPGQAIFRSGDRHAMDLQELEANHRERARDHADTVALVYEARLDAAREAGKIRERLALVHGELVVAVKDSERRGTEAARAEGDKTRELINAIERERLRDRAFPFQVSSGTTVLARD